MSQHVSDRTRVIAAAAAVATCALLIVVACGDDYFRDEFYYLACSQHLAWGYVDQPPLSVAVLWIVTKLVGDSLIVLRVVAAVSAGLTVYVTGRIASRLGGNRFAVALACIATALAPNLLGVGSIYSMNVFDVLIWTVVALLLVEIDDAPSTRRWILLGVVLGAGLLNKISVLWLGAGLAVGLIVTARRRLLTAGPWLSAAIAGVIALPYALWQIANGWPTLEFIHNAGVQKMQTNTPWSFMADQVMNMNPILSLVWIAGLLFLLVSPRARGHRILAVIYVAVLTILIANRTSRAEYLTPAYPMLFAAGGVALAALAVTRTRRIAALTVAFVAGAVTVPLAVPVLSTDRYIAYAAALHVAPSTEEKKELGRLPQFFADRQGWRAMVAQIEAAWDTLSQDDRARAVVMTGNYGEAGAVTVLTHGRLPVISGHNNYWLWGPGDHDVVLVLSRSRERQESRFDRVQAAGQIDCGDCMPYENGLTIFIDRAPKVPLRLLWPSLKHYE